MFSLEVENPDIPCPECQRILVELAKFRRVMHEDGSLGSDAPIFVFSGFRFALNPVAMYDWFNGAWDALFLHQRNKKVERLAAEILPRYPNTLICPNCLYLWRRI